MSQPVPDAPRQPSVFPVPAHVDAVLIGGGCGSYHFPVNGAVDCAICFPQAQGFVFPAAPAQEQAVAASAEPAPSPPAAAAPDPVAPAPAPDAAPSKTASK